MAKIGLQLYSIKEISEKDFFGAIRLAADCGYDGIEFAGFFNTPAKKLKKLLGDNGIDVCGSHTGISSLIDEVEEIAEYNLEIGNEYIIVPALPEEMRNSRDAWLRTADTMNKLEEKLSKYGIKLGYHNHAYEFDKFNGIRGYDIFAGNTNPSILLEIDTYWVAYPGIDVIEYVKKYKDRLDLIHLKDMGPDVKNIEIGSGSLDFPKIVEAAEFTNWFIVEQEYFTIPMEESIRISCEYLKGLVR
jgi:sugar phosphate isomerase/epimerase